MNKVTSQRLISKQECMVLLGGLHLVDCSETIESVSITNSTRIKSNQSKNNPKNNFLNKYQNRSKEQVNMSLEDYYLLIKNGHSTSTEEKLKIPNFVGVNGSPKFPLTYGYARHILIVHKPWLHYPFGDDPIKEANSFLNSQDCPISVRIPYQRAVQRHKNKLEYYEPKAVVADHSKNEITKEDKEELEIFGLHGDPDAVNFDTSIFQRLHRGKDFEWDKTPKVRH